MAIVGVVELGQLVQVVWVSLSATIVVAGAFALVVRETGRSADAQRRGRGGDAALHAGLALLFLTAFGALVALGVIVMVSK
jgi:hypothetical protein